MHFGTNGGQQLPEAQLVGRMLLQRLATGATGVKQARYTHCLLTTYGNIRTCVVYERTSQYGVAIEFRRGFCTLVLFISLCFMVNETYIMYIHTYWCHEDGLYTSLNPLRNNPLVEGVNTEAARW